MMKKYPFFIFIMLMGYVAYAQQNLDYNQFMIPKKEYFPETWFHFVGGNISQSGITADLEAIAAAGFKGVQLFHGNIGDGSDWPVTQEHIECLSPKWEGLVSHTAAEAHRLGLNFTMQTCPGWATSGGPWIQSSQAMRNVVCTRMITNNLDSLLQQPLPLNAYTPEQDYQDIAVLIFPTPLGDEDMPLCERKFQQSEAILSPTTTAQPHIIDLQLDTPALARTLVMRSLDAFNHEHGPAQYISVKLTAVVNAQEITVLESPLPYASWQDNNDAFPLTLALDECSATDHYRLYIVNRYPMAMSWVRLLAAAQKSNWTAEAGHTLRTILYSNQYPQQNSLAYIQKDDIQHCTVPIVDYTKLQGQKAGSYTVLRIGHVNALRKNSPAPAEATGWEVDKFNAEAVDYQFNCYVGLLNRGVLKGLMDNMLLDSWECGSQTWTPRMADEFRRVAGYDLQPWLPALFGYVIDNPDVTSRFLDDWRRTQNDLFVHKFYKRMADNAHSLGLQVHYETAAADVFPGDPLEYYKWADVPMCEFWQPFGHFLADHNYKPIRPTASAARMYGKKRVSAEAFTSFALTWDEHLQMLRDVANQNMVEGVSHLVFHTYTHNPGADTYKPGSSFGGGIGSPFLRNQTWWPYMNEFTTYLARCCYMLEAGTPVSQVLWYLGDEIQQKPDQYYPFPEGFMYDYCNHDALMTRISVKDGKWVTPEGIAYDVLWIPERGRLLPETVERLLLLVQAGGTLFADKPLGCATLADNQDQQDRFQRAAHKLWSLERVLPANTDFYQISAPDVQGVGNRWCHRRTAEQDIYFITSQPETSFSGEVSFASIGEAELWDPVTGTRTLLTTTQRGNRSYLHLDLPVAGSVFVLFKHCAEKRTPASPAYTPTKCVLTLPLTTLPWTLTFPKGWGVGKPIRIRSLLPWCELPISEEGRAFSGTVAYNTSFKIKRKEDSCRYVLSLGDVDMVAEVIVNGQPVAKLWTTPFETDITDLLLSGKNQLEIRVTSSWYNRLVYDARQPGNQRKTWVIAGPSADNPLKRYGLLGPVEVRVER